MNATHAIQNAAFATWYVVADDISEVECVKRLYTVSMTLAVDDENREAVIEAARKCYADADGSSETDDEGAERDIPPDEAVESIDTASLVSQR
jgi:hypothetical protein